MSDDKHKNPFDGPGAQGNPLEALAAATALGVTVATQAMGFWLSMLSGVTAAAREPHSAPEPQRQPEAKTEKPVQRPSAEVVILKPKPVESRPVAAVTEKPAAPKPEPAKADSIAPPVQNKPEPEVAAPAAPVKAVEPKPEPLMAKAAAQVVLDQAPAPSAQSKTAPKAAAKKAAAPKPAMKEAAPALATAPVAKLVAAAAVEAMRQPKAQEKPAAPDDLKLIKGIGPKLETTLNGLGVWTYAQIAALEPAEVVWLDDYLGLGGRIVRDGWIEAAKAGGKNG